MTETVARSRREELEIGASTLIADGLHRALTASYRMRFLAPSYARRRAAGEPGRCVYATWHEMLWHGIGALRDEGVCVLVSTHRDGEMIARVVARQGFKLARGSSTRGGAQGLRDFLRVSRQHPNVDLCVTVDGPKGPRRELKPGVLFTAAMTGLPIVPLAVAVRPTWRLGTWDRLMIGKPFARVAVTFGDEVSVPRDVDRERLVVEFMPRVVAAMDRAERACQEALAIPGDPS